MAGLNLFTNNAATTLASSLTNVATTITVAAGTGSLFPTLTGSQYCYCTLANNAGTVEIVKVTARSTDTFTVVRGQDGTSAVAWNSGDKFELRLVRASLVNFPQLDSTNTFSDVQTFTSAAVFTANPIMNGLSASLPVFTDISKNLTNTGVIDIAHGGTNNGSLAVTAGGLIYTDGSKQMNTGAGTSGQVLQSNGSAAPTWVTLSTLGGATETTTSSDVTLTSSSNRVQKVTQTGTGKSFILPDATTFSAPGSPIFNLGAVTGSPMFIKYSDGYRCSSVTTTSGAQVSLSNITNAQTGYAINNVYPIIKVTDQAVVASLANQNANAAGDGISQFVAIDQIDTNKYIVGYVNVSTATAYVVVATQSGSTFSFGTPVALTNTANGSSWINVVGLSTTTAFVVFATSGGNIQCQGLTISGTTVTASATANIGGSAAAIFRAFKLTSTTALFSYASGTVSTASVNFRVATHNGALAPTFGAQVSTGGSTVGNSMAFTCLLSSTKFLAVYGRGNKALNAICGTIAGTAITLGTELTVTSSLASNQSTQRGVLAYSATEAFFIGTDFYGYLTVSGTTITLGSLNTVSPYTVSNALVAPYTTTGNTLMNDSLIVTYSGSGSFTVKSNPSYTGQNYSTGLGNVIAGSSTSYINAGTEYLTQYPAIWITAQVA